MSLHRRNPRRDANEPEVIEAFQKLGYSVQPLSARGVPDLLVAKGAAMHLVEVKTAKGKLRVEQAGWAVKWQGPPPILVRSAEDVIAIFGSG